MSKTVRKIPTVKLTVEEATRVRQGRATAIDLMKAGLGFQTRDTVYVTPGEKAAVKRLHSRKDRRTGRNEIRDLLMEAQEEARILLNEMEEEMEEWEWYDDTPIGWDDIYDDDDYEEEQYCSSDVWWYESSWDW